MSIEEQEKAIKMVQELAEAGNERYRFNADTKIPRASNIPIIDFNHKYDLDKLMPAIQSWGMFQVISDVLPSTFLDEVRDVLLKFFYLPLEEKQKINDFDSNAVKPHGYYHHNAKLLDWCDHLLLKVQLEDDNSLNHWPEKPIAFRKTIYEFDLKSRKLADIILSDLAKMLKIDDDYFINKLGKKACAHARFNYYPQCSENDLGLGLFAHTDGSLITIVVPDKEVEGLQVLKDGSWFKVPLVNDAVLIVFGDQIQLLSNGIFKSPVHRAVADVRERSSISLFFGVTAGTFMEPAEGLVDEKRPCMHKKMTKEDFFKVYLVKQAQRLSTIEWAKV